MGYTARYQSYVQVILDFVKCIKFAYSFSLFSSLNKPHLDSLCVSCDMNCVIFRVFYCQFINGFSRDLRRTQSNLEELWKSRSVKQKPTV